MISGREALSFFDDALHKEQASITNGDDQIGEISNQLIELRKARMGDLRELARVRVDVIAHDASATYDNTERQVASLLQARHTSLADLDQQLQTNASQAEALTLKRASQAEALTRVDERVDTAEAETQARLDADPAYQQQRNAAQQAERIAMHAADKAANSEREQDEKGQAYRDDPLFMYLWRRNYGKTDYRSSRLIHWLDAKVARLVGYADAMANYTRLQEIPVRLREHADGKQQAADQAFELLRQLDEAARRRDGIDKLEAQRDQEQAALDAIDQQIEQLEDGRQALLAEKEAYAVGQDRHYRQAVEYMTSELKQDELRELRRDALATPFPEDDLIVNRLLQHERDEQALEATLEEARQALQRQRVRAEELESIRREFRRKRYDQRGFSFGDGSLVAMMLQSFLSGMLDRRALWKVLQQQGSYRPPRADPTFGSGGFGRGTVWGGKRGGGLGDIFGGGVGGRGGGGGFRTGGGF